MDAFEDQNKSGIYPGWFFGIVWCTLHTTHARVHPCRDWVINYLATDKVTDYSLTQ